MAASSVSAARASLCRLLCRRCGLHPIAASAGAIGPVIPSPIRSYGLLHPSCQFLSSVALSPEPTNEAPSDPGTLRQQQAWRIVAAVCVQRMPKLSTEMTALELDYEEMRNQVRLEKSKLSDYELEESDYESKKRERIKKAQEEGSHVKGTSDETDDFEDLLESREIEFQEFEPASRLTEADKTGDMRSLDRQLHRVLYLLVKKPREEHAWQMPQGGVEREESLVEAAKREFSEECGSSMQVDFYSNAPSAMLSYKHSPVPNDQHSSLESKVFFLKAVYRNGALTLDGKELVDHMWVTKEEMKDYVSKEYYRAVEPILTA